MTKDAVATPGALFGSALPIQPRRMEPAARPGGDVVADVPPGVHTDHFSQAMVPFAGQHQLPTGQNITVSMNAPSPHLTFREWMLRGTVGAAGMMLAWPFKLAGGLIEAAFHAVLGVVKWAAIILLVPTLIMAGIKLQQKMSSAASIEEGAATLVHDGRHAVNGVGRGLTDDLPPEKAGGRKATADRAEREAR